MRIFNFRILQKLIIHRQRSCYLPFVFQLQCYNSNNSRWSTFHAVTDVKSFFLFLGCHDDDQKFHFIRFIFLDTLDNCFRCCLAWLPALVHCCLALWMKVRMFVDFACAHCQPRWSPALKCILAFIIMVTTRIIMSTTGIIVALTVFLICF